MSPRRHGLLAAGFALVCAVPAAATHAAPSLPLLATGTTTRVSVGPHGEQAYGDDGSLNSATSPDGRYVAFSSYASGLGTGMCSNTDGSVPGRAVYLRDRKTGTTELIWARKICDSTHLFARPYESAVSVSADGRCVAYSGGESESIFVRDRVAKRTIAASPGWDGRPNNQAAVNPAISADCSAVAFESDATNLLPDQSPKNFSGVYDVYVRDLRRGRTERVGPNIRELRNGGWDKLSPSISGTGRYVTFACRKPDLVKTKANPYLPYLDLVRDSGPQQMYVFDRTTKNIEMASISDAGYPGNADVDATKSGGRTISADGRYVVFASAATNLVPGNDPVWTATGHGTVMDGDATQDVYRYDRLAHHVTLVSAGPGGVPGNDMSFDPAISGDGRWVAYTSGASNLGSVDATPVAFSWWWPWDPMDDATVVGYDVYLYDTVTGTNRLISVSTLGVQGDRYSHQPFVNYDATVVSYTSRADNLVDGDTNGLLDVFVYERPR